MRFFQVAISGAALIAAALAVELNDVPSSIEPGKTYTITYSPKDNTPTTLKLRKGDPNDLKDVAVLTTTATGGSFQWTVDNALTNAKDYALEIDQEGAEPNYSGQITLSGGSDSASSAVSASASASSASASGASSTGASSTQASATGESTLITTTATGASASVSSSAGLNATVSTGRPSSTGSGSSATGSGSPTTGAGAPENTGAASTLASSPLALIFGAIAAMAYLN